MELMKTKTKHIRGFLKLYLCQIGLIEPICVTLGIGNINLCTTSKLPIIKIKFPCDNGISCREMFTVNKK